ncbi:MAG: hypothetical protein RI575_03190 [Balneolaceae bacterium]|nr:hypothetical protein [Balneolaceae bacterium]MDR9408210.1 hypothetical protein [Balneolaceae bacterium]
MAFLQRAIPYNHPESFTPSGKNRTTEIGILYMIDHLSSRDKAKLFSFSERHSHFLNFKMDSHRFIPFFTPNNHMK